MGRNIFFTYEEVKTFFENNGYTLLSENYERATERLDFMDKQGYKYRLTYLCFYGGIKRKSKFDRFYNKNPYTIENISNWLELNKPTISLYPNQNVGTSSKERLFFKCSICPDGEIPIYTQFERFISGRGCSYCTGRSVGKFNNLEYMFPEISKEWDYLNNNRNPSDYTYGSNKHVYWICPKGHGSYSAAIVTQTRGRTGCKICSRNTLLEYDFVKEQFESFGYNLISKDYAGIDEKLEFSDFNGYKYFANYNAAHGHNKSGVLFDKFTECNPFSFYNLNLFLSSTDWFCELVGGKFTDVSTTSLVIRCKYCGTTYNTSWNAIRMEQCRHCKESRGEHRIRRFLTKNFGTSGFTPQFKLDGCRAIRPLPFDFGVEKKGLNLIEYQGLQHYEPVSYFGGEKKFLENKRRDKMKEDYCKNNGINLIIIGYWDYDNIEKILTRELEL